MVKRLPAAVHESRAAARLFARQARQQAQETASRQARQAREVAKIEAADRRWAAKFLKNLGSAKPRRGPLAYQRRIASQVLKGKTRQQARGHAPGEAKRRRAVGEQRYGTPNVKLHPIIRAVSRITGQDYDSPTIQWLRDNPSAAPYVLAKLENKITERRAGAGRISMADWEDEWSDTMFDDAPTQLIYYHGG